MSGGYAETYDACSASNVEHIVAAPERECGKNVGTMLAKASHQHMSPLVEFGHEYRIPEIDVLALRFDCARNIHNEAPISAGRLGTVRKTADVPHLASFSLSLKL